MIKSIKPVGGYPKPGIKLKVDNVLVDLDDNTINCQWTILNEDGETTAGPARIAVKSEQMDKWTGGNDYIVACVAANLVPPLTLL